MSRIGSKNTKPEMVVRRLAHALGYRFRLHRKDLPGRPDIVFPSRRTVVFVHGCFWHRHEGCKLTSVPKSNEEFWQAKFARNIERDRAAVEGLKSGGWGVLTVWECETRNTEALAVKLQTHLRETTVRNQRRFYTKASDPIVLAPPTSKNSQ